MSSSSNGHHIAPEHRIVDVDVHTAAPTFEDVAAYLPDTWGLDHWERFRAGPPIYATPMKAGVFRWDTMPPAGGLPASDPEFMATQLLTEAGVDLAILWPLICRHVADPDDEAIVCRATNSWLAETWLTEHNAHGRYRGTIMVSGRDPQAAVKEIERWCDDPRFVQIGFDPLGVPPMGERLYDPIYEIAVEHRLPIGLHFITSPGMNLLTPVGFQAYAMEFHALFPLTFVSHAASLICGGAFDRFPDLKVVMLESGTSWIVPLVWRLQHCIEEFGDVKLARDPADYVARNLGFATQPLEEPERAKDLWDLLGQGSTDDSLLFATDYPHWDYDEPAEVFKRLPAHIRDRVMSGNADRIYDLA